MKYFQETYYYAIAFLDGFRSYGTDPLPRTAHKICGVIACTKLNDRKSCGERHKSSAKIYNRLRFGRIDLSADLAMSNMKIIPNTVAMNLHSIQTFNWYAEMYFFLY